MAELTRPDAVQFLKDLSNLPPDLLKEIKAIKSRSKVTLNVEEEGSKALARNQGLTYFRPTILKNIQKASKGWHENRGNYRLCVSARGADHVRVIFDSVKVSEYKDRMDRKHVVKKEHLTPLEKAFDESSALGRSIIDEMHYMEKREIRMKRTADGTNSRIRFFSYVSIAVLLGVTWLQIQYLKGYFKKKKIL